MMDHPMTTAAVGVSILVASFSPQATDVLKGDTVTWSNDSNRQHTVTAVDGSFASATVFTGDRYAHEFDANGAVPYFCTIHPFMRGEVDVFSLLLDAPSAPASPNRPYPISGRAALPAGSAVAIEGDDGGGFRRVASAVVGDDGHFSATVTPATTTTYRAVSGTDATPPVRLLVLDRHVTARASRHGKRTLIRVRVDPASPHATIVLQLHLRERFGWWPVRRTKLSHHSTAAFRIATPHRRLRARAVLTLPDGATALARSAEVHVGRSRPHR
jgi:plastocyanin